MDGLHMEQSARAAEKSSNPTSISTPGGASTECDEKSESKISRDDVNDANKDVETLTCAARDPKRNSKTDIAKKLETLHSNSLDVADNNSNAQSVTLNHEIKESNKQNNDNIKCDGAAGNEGTMTQVQNDSAIGTETKDLNEEGNNVQNTETEMKTIKNSIDKCSEDKTSKQKEEAEILQVNKVFSKRVGYYYNQAINENNDSKKDDDDDDDDDEAVYDMLDGVPYTSDNAAEDQKERSQENEAEVLEFVKKGSDLTKIRSRRRTYNRFFRIDYSGVMLTYLGSRKSLCTGGNVEEKNQVYMSSIREVREGRMTDVFDRVYPQGSFAPDANRCFSLVIGDDNETLDLVAPDEITQKNWVRSLRYLMRKFSEKNLENVQHIFINDLFRKADKNGDGSLCLKEVVKLLKKFNLHVEPHHAFKLFHAANFKRLKNKDNEEGLDAEEFTKFIELITKREELEELFQRYDHGTKFWTVEDIMKFFSEVQGEKLTESRCTRLIEQCESCPSVRDSGKLSLRGFYVMCNSSWMDIRRSKTKKVYQDMCQPLSYYFIDSSHNTYLAEDQLKGPSRVESYIKALKSGCRCVELDVWDGENSEPVIYHGYTLTSKILLKDVLEAIEKYAFVSSKYPVILSIENHLSLDQQEVMAGYFKNIFKDQLLTTPLPPQAECLPAPEQLKGMIIIKGKKLPDIRRSISHGDRGDGRAAVLEDGEVSDEDEAADMEDEEVSQKVKQKKSEGHEKQKLAKSLSDCVIICQSASFKNFEQSKASTTFRQISSLVESKALELAKSEGSRFVKHNSWQLTRIYPSGFRTDSSNYDPVPLWCVGCQLVALNYQTDDVPMFVNKGMFEDNGGCGYVLKPQFLRTGTGQYNPRGPYINQWKRIMEIKVISGYQLPKKKHDKTNSILDPYVKISVHGVEADCKQYKTPIIENNGFHPVWNETFKFDVNCPELAIVLFRVYDYETKSRNVAVCQYSLPMRTMQTGYRVVHLKSLMGEPLVAASLLIHVSISQPN